MVVMGFRQQDIPVERMVCAANTLLLSAVHYLSEQTRIPLRIDISSKLVDGGDRYAAKTENRIIGLEKDSQAVLLFFESGNGSGSSKIPSLEHVLKQDTPRPKEGFAEIYLPIGSVYTSNSTDPLTRQSIFIPYFTSLDAVTTNKDVTDIMNYAYLGTGPENYFPIVSHIHPSSTGTYSTCRVQLTFLGKKFGNPHAIRFTEESAAAVPGSIIQIGAFIALTDEKETKKVVSCVEEKKHFRGYSYASAVVL